MSSKNVELRKEEFRVTKKEQEASIDSGIGTDLEGERLNAKRREESLCLGLGSSQGPRPCAPPPRRRPGSRARPTPRRWSSRAGGDESFGYLGSEEHVAESAAR